MNQENIDLAIKNVQSFILQNHRDLSGGEKLTKIVIERIEKSEEYFSKKDTTVLSKSRSS